MEQSERARYIDVATGALRPARPRLADALAAIFDVDPGWVRDRVARGTAATAFREVWGAARGPTPSCWEAWELCATRGLLPADAVEDPSRTYLAHVSQPTRSIGGRYAYGIADGAPVRVDPAWLRRALADDGGEYAADLPHPPTLHAVATLASDWDAVLQVEALAREAHARLAPWGVPSVERVSWRFGFRRVALRASEARLDDAAVTDALARALDPRTRATRRPTLRACREADPAGFACVETLLDAALVWQQAVREGARVPAQTASAGPQVLAGRRFAELADPYEPLLDAARRGYLVGGLDESVMALVALDVLAEG